MKTCTFIIGADRVGKSTYCKKLSYELGEPVSVFHWGVPERNAPSPLHRFNKILECNTHVVSDRFYGEWAFNDRVLCNITYSPDYVASEVSRFENKLKQSFDVRIVVLQRDWDAEMVKRHQAELDQTNYAPWFKEAQMRYREWLHNEFYHELPAMLSNTMFPYEVKQWS